MSKPQQVFPAPVDGEANLTAVYQAVCNRHQQIDEFRGKLLALLPIASGAACHCCLVNRTRLLNT